MSNRKQASERGADRKAFLFCPECSRSAPIGEEWPLTRRDGRAEIDCPNCGAVLVSQPYFDSDRRSPITV